jgi:hypothetical protein
MDPFDIDLSALDLEYGADCGAPALAIHLGEAFCDHHDAHNSSISSLWPMATPDLLGPTTPEGSSPEHSPPRAKHFKRRKSTELEARKRTLRVPPPSPENAPADERFALARGALYNLYGEIQRERAETFRVLTLLANENRRLAMHANTMAEHNTQLATHLLQLAGIVHTNAVAETPVAKPPSLSPLPQQPPSLLCRERLPRERKRRH